MKILKRAAFYLLVAVIVFIAVFPFYYAIVTSLKSGTELFEANLWPKSLSLANYTNVLTEGTFLRNLVNSLVVSGAVVLISLLLGVTAAYSLARVRFRGRSALMLGILSVSMFPQVAVLAGLFEMIRWAGLYNSLLALIFSYMIFTLPFTVWVLTTFVRDLPVEIEEAAILDGATPWIIISQVFLPLMWPALATTGMLAFIGMPAFYTYNLALALKIIAVLLAMTMLALFYLTSAYHDCEGLPPGGDAPWHAKVLAGTSLFLWFAVVVLGRYIQPAENSIHR